jgi:type IV secretory pathway protease TraF
MRNSLNHKLSIYFFALVLAAAGAWFVHRNIAVALTPSLRYTVFYLGDRHGEGIRPGDYVVFNLDHPVIAHLKIKKAIKEAVCVSGQVLTASDKDYYCNGRYLGMAKEFSHQGEKMENFIYDGVVPSGSLFVMGHHKDSFDSRYFGFIKVDDVEKIARPLI